jgi:hypothetical protein
MRERNIAGISRRKGSFTMVRDRDAWPAPGVVDRKFVATRPNQL